MSSGKMSSMASSKNLPPLPTIEIESSIHLIRGHRVMLDSDLANLYGVQVKVLNQAVKRNIDRFPSDFMFQITHEEWEVLRSQIVTSSFEHGGRRTPPYVFTQEGVAMLSGVLRSERAISVNIEIMRAFVRFRSLLAGHQDLINRLDTLEQRYDKQFAMVFDAIRQIMTPERTSHKLGFRTEVE